MHWTLNKICIAVLIEIAFKVSKNKLFPNVFIILKDIIWKKE
jgi:hypothetical protein